MKWYGAILIIYSSIIFATYYSQYGQDQYVNEEIFKNKKGGIFVDIGAHDGIRFSNTYFFEKELNWTGLCIEPIPQVFERLCKNRTSTCVQGCISNEPGINAFLQIDNNKLGERGPEMLSGLIDSYDPRHCERIKKEIAIDDSSTHVLMINCYLLNSLCDQYNINHIDYLSIDTEGAELMILKSIDYDRISIDIIDVENNYYDPEFARFLESKGFIKITSLGSDELYRNKKYCS